MSERMNIVVPDGQTATLMRKGKPLLRWPEKSIIGHDLEDGDEIVLSDNKPAPQASPLDVLAAKVRRDEMELAATAGEFREAVDDVIDALLAANTLRAGQLKGPTNATLAKRKTIRNRIAQLRAEIEALTRKP